MTGGNVSPHHWSGHGYRVLQHSTGLQRGGRGVVIAAVVIVEGGDEKTAEWVEVVFFCMRKQVRALGRSSTVL